MKSGPHRFGWKIGLALAVGVGAAVAIYLFSVGSERFFEEKNRIVRSLDRIKHAELNLNYVISASSDYLYKNNDMIVDAVRQLENELAHLRRNGYFVANYPAISRIIADYARSIAEKIDKVYTFQSYSAGMKNSITYIARLLNELPRLNARLNGHRFNRAYRERFVSTVSTIFLTQNSLDDQLLKSIDTAYFEKMEFDNPQMALFNDTFVAHLKVFTSYYPAYHRLMHEILDPSTLALLEKADRRIYRQAGEKLEAIKMASYLLIGFILLYTAIVIALLLRSYRENRELNRLTAELSRLVRTDTLTRLPNRFRYEEEVQEKREWIFFLVNIDKFKYINNYYGTVIGDKVLIKVADVLKEIVCQKRYGARFYRLGADDFGVLMPMDRIDSPDRLCERIVHRFEKEDIDVGAFRFRIGVSVAYSRERPYFEKANIALKKVKESSRLKFLAYSPAIDNKEAVLRNIERTKVLFDALREKRVVPYFQPIVDLRSGEVVKYEVLTRVILQDGRVESIYPYLQIAKDNKLYADITETVLRQTIERYGDGRVALNLNFSVEDIMDDRIMTVLDDMRRDHPRLMRRITFEILESESIHDYDIIKQFIREVKRHGAGVAIDDFGSGYSNFEHLLNLEIDYLKIDGSLIRHLPRSRNAQRIIRLINRFAHESGIETVAEFVENEEIVATLKKMEIDYGQGYYFGKPVSGFELGL